jgi:hypothetical protein
LQVIKYLCNETEKILAEAGVKKIRFLIIIIVPFIIYGCATVHIKPAHKNYLEISKLDQKVYIVLTEQQIAETYINHSMWFLGFKHTVYTGEALKILMVNTFSEYYENVVVVQSVGEITDKSGCIAVVPRITSFYLDATLIPRLSLDVQVYDKGRSVMEKSYNSESYFSRGTEIVLFILGETDTEGIRQQTKAVFEQTSYKMMSDYMNAMKLPGSY